jgi:hypothetical protein
VVRLVVGSFDDAAFVGAGRQMQLAAHTQSTGLDNSSAEGRSGGQEPASFDVTDAMDLPREA